MGKGNFTPCPRLYFGSRLCLFCVFTYCLHAECLTLYFYSRLSSTKPKFYVVWRGREPGIYYSWEDCQRQVVGFPAALYKSFKSEAEALQAFAAPANDYVATAPQKSMENNVVRPNNNAAAAHAARAPKGCPPPPPDYRNDTVLPLPPEVKADALAVDAACSGNPGPMEYRGVYLATGQEIFHYGPVHGTNNIGEFLAIVHALALLKQQGRTMTIYSDSRNALLWIKARKCRTKLARTARTEQLFQLIERAETWLRTHDFADIPLLKWETSQWGEVPADFGRK